MLLWRALLSLCAALSALLLFAEGQPPRQHATLSLAAQHDALAPLRARGLCVYSVGEGESLLLLCPDRAFSRVDFDDIGRISASFTAWYNASASASERERERPGERVTPFLAVYDFPQSETSEACAAEHAGVYVRYECCAAHRAALGETQGLVRFPATLARTDSQSHSLAQSAAHNTVNSDDGLRDALSASHTFLADILQDECCVHVTVCSPLVCEPHTTEDKNNATKTQTQAQAHAHTQTETEIESASQRERETENAISSVRLRALRDEVREMFTHAYNAYMQHAFPMGELRPISCQGGHFDLVKIPFVTLIDTLDTLVVMGNHEEFRRAVSLLSTHLLPPETHDDAPTHSQRGFDFDVNVSVFETTIRLLGGLLSAHLLALDPRLAIYSPSHTHVRYSGELLTLAVDLGERLLPAFSTKTGIPFGTVNLRTGVPRGETPVASTAGAGSLLLEFHTLSLLTQDMRFSRSAYLAMTALYTRRSKLDLVGKHINTESGAWQETASGLGSNADSFFEYMVKGYALLHSTQAHTDTHIKSGESDALGVESSDGEQEKTTASERDQFISQNVTKNVPNTHTGQSAELLQMFLTLYVSAKRFLVPQDEWFAEADMFSGKLLRWRTENLDAFWPGIESSLGEISSSARQLNAFFAVSLDLGLFPEEIDVVQWQAGKGPSNALYPLRPELVESTLHHFLATSRRDPRWLSAGEHILRNLQRFARTGCGYASVSSVLSMQLQDEMPSFFLSETAKYLFLLFDDEHAMHERAVLFSTEAHPLDLVQLAFVSKQIKAEKAKQRNEGNRYKESKKNKKAGTKKKRGMREREKTTQSQLKQTRRFPPTSEQIDTHNRTSAITLSRTQAERVCAKTQWWTPLLSFDALALSQSLPRTAAASASLSHNTPTADSPTAQVERAESPSVIRHKERRAQASERLARILSRTITRESERRATHSQKCRRGDTPTAPQTQSSPQSSSAQTQSENTHAHANVLRSVEIALGSLGSFTVHVLADGFVVQNALDARTLEVINVGRRQVLVRESVTSTGHTHVESEKESESVRHASTIGLPFGASTLCAVRVYENNKTVWDRPCSIGSFGQSGSFKVRGPLVVAPDDLCPATPLQQAAKAASQRSSAVLNAGQRNVVANAMQALISKLSQRSHTRKDGEQGDREGADMWKSSVVAVRRGGCMFEDKALLAQRRGAVAAVVRNNENNLFIMAGKKDVEKEEKNVFDTVSTVQQSTEADTFTEIASVMVTDRDGAALETFAQTTPPSTEENKGISREIEIAVMQRHALLSSELMGDRHFPKIWTSPGAIYTLTSGLWGAYFKSMATKGQEARGGNGEQGDWQMFLIDRRDITAPSLIPPTTLRTRAGQRVTSSVSLSQHSAALYAWALKRKCPRRLSVNINNPKIVHLIL